MSSKPVLKAPGFVSLIDGPFELGDERLVEYLDISMR